MMKKKLYLPSIVLPILLETLALQHRACISPILDFRVPVVTQDSPGFY